MRKNQHPTALPHLASAQYIPPLRMRASPPWLTALALVVLLALSRGDDSAVIQLIKAGSADLTAGTRLLPHFRV